MVRAYFLIILSIQILFFNLANAQTGINTRNPHPSSALEIANTDKGFLITRVPITNLNDKITVLNPTKGMVIIALNDSDPAFYGDTESVKKGNLYKFNGNNWDEIIELEKPSTGIMFPELVAYGYKESGPSGTPEIPITGLATAPFALATTKRYKNYVTLFKTDGSITVSKTGYYVWTMQIIYNAFGNNGTSKLALTRPGLVTYSFRNLSSSASVKALQPFSMSGSIFLNAGDSSEGFKWELNAVGSAGETIYKQSVLWQYIGK